MWGPYNYQPPVKADKSRCVICQAPKPTRGGEPWVYSTCGSRQCRAKFSEEKANGRSDKAGDH
jgi:hypothetical protein